ncbi:MAG: GH25 family lysozyme [Chitinophagales bacterium]
MSKKKNKKLRASIYALLFAAFVGLAFAYQKQIIRYSYKAYRYYRKQFRHPRKGKFQTITFPETYNVHGIDVSHHQEIIDWNQLKTKDEFGDTIAFRFAFIKATEGSWSVDVAFADNWEEAHENKIICGAYHYFLADKDPVKQAQNFCSTVDLKAGDFPPVIDIEETRGKSKAEIVAAVKVMAEILDKRYGAKPIIYSNISFIEDYLADDFSDYYFWVAHYYEEELHIADEVHWIFWQHNDKAMIFGCDNSLDVNVFNGNMTLLKAFLLKGQPVIRPAE